MIMLQQIRVTFQRLLIPFKKSYYRLKGYKVYQQIKQLKKEMKAENRKELLRSSR
jgi:hypothetical protein